MPPTQQPVVMSMPAAPLRPYISHYWLGLDNSDANYAIVPDGAVDVVLVIGAATCRVDAFGTATTRLGIQLELGKHYLGIRFRPGQSRHFLDARTSDLTNAVHSAEGTFLPDLSGVAESIHLDSIFGYLDAALGRHLQRRAPCASRIDDVIRYMEVANGPLRVSELAAMYCKSRRQFERTFLDVVGLSPKLFTEIVRFRRASALLARSNLSLAQIAADIGYTDQSHFTHEFSRFFGLPPVRARAHAAFLQDTNSYTENNTASLNL